MKTKDFWSIIGWKALNVVIVFIDFCAFWNDIIAVESECL